jgi:phytoene synthase
LYAQIGLEVERRGLNAVDGRAVVGTPRKLWGLARALLALSPDDAQADAPPLPATRWLVEAVTGPLTPQLLQATPRGLAQVIALIERLERRDRDGHSDGSSERAPHRHAA